ncbi:unnamed protein product [Protopolystoma xenopodis]|uniref:Cadherin domain-containing protein n=1 Tax=Protopolystoma xenopodis TaxID=117903 RepID=A0A448WEC8_9PLAT|nr:unnamed protein product [Protopolystoma xenopodis]
MLSILMLQSGTGEATTFQFRNYSWLYTLFSSVQTYALSATVADGSQTALAPVTIRVIRAPLRYPTFSQSTYSYTFAELTTGALVPGMFFTGLSSYLHVSTTNTKQTKTANCKSHISANVSTASQQQTSAQWGLLLGLFGFETTLLLFLLPTERQPWARSESQGSPAATDPNIPALFTYSIEGAFSTSFSISSTTGALAIATGLPRDAPTGFPVSSKNLKLTE